jgi:hypothetical protein
MQLKERSTPMRMTRWISMALVAVLVFAVAGIAVAAKNRGNAQPTESAQATFTATPTDKSKTRQCTGVDGTYNITKGVYTGTSESPDPRLAGNITIKTKSVVNLDNGLGHTKGKVFLRDADSRKLKAVAGLQAVNTERGVLNGFIAGSVKNATASSKAKRGRSRGSAGTKLAANFTAAFNADGTQLSGELGTGAGQNTAVLYGNPCQPPERQPSSQSDGRRGDDDKRGGRRGDDDR